LGRATNWFLFDLYCNSILEDEVKVVKDSEFTVMQWNILADMYSYSATCNPEYLKWTYRGPLIVKEIEHHSPDIVCLEEVDRFEGS
jgi:mRNA deadenylase 3'-5' endonuclease subunit Ccr4